MDKYIVAHDLGTTGNKATLFSTSGKMIKSTIFSYPVNFFNGNWAEQNPQHWWDAICAATKSLLEDIDSSRVCAISFSGQMMGCVCVDQDGVPLRPAIIWADMRAEQQEYALAEKISPKEFYKTVGHKISRSYSIEKLMWIKDNEPAVYGRTHKMLHAKDYIVYKLTGEFLTDYSDASGTNALDLNTMAWSDKIICAAGVEKSMFPEIRPSTFVAGIVQKRVSHECGLPEGTKVIIGGGDGSCASVGAGSVSEGITYNCLGSSSWISTVSKKPYFDEEMRTVTWAHVIPGLLIPSGTMQTAGAAFAWGKERLYDCLQHNEEDIYEIINKQIAASDAGSNALLFLPYLLGERCPRWNGNARGSFIGLKMEHSRGDMMRSIVEGVAMNLDIILKILKNAVEIKEMLVVGGLAKGDIQQQILADVYGMDIVRLVHLEEATSIGAAVIGGIGAGELPDFSSASLFNKRMKSTEPVAEHVKKYNQLKPVFNKAYWGQIEVYEDLARI